MTKLTLSILLAIEPQMLFAIEYIIQTYVYD